MTPTPEDGRQLAVKMARLSIKPPNLMIKSANGGGPSERKPRRCGLPSGKLWRLNLPPARRLITTGENHETGQLGGGSITIPTHKPPSLGS